MANLSTSFQFWQLPKYDQRKDESSLTLQTSNKLPKPGPGEALIRIRAVSLNYRDLIISRNLYPSSNLERDELIPGSDGAGDIVEIGEKVENFRIGDRVVANFNPAFKRGMVAKEKEMKSALGGPAQGILTSLIVLPVDALLRIPSHLSYEEASTLPCAAVTAWNGLYGLRDIPLLPVQTFL
ncbi:hypothetical protein L7F22_067907 [Adiantum nelumboides]|nr:hypothetical protein [Adiantum nelumboides]